VTRYCHGSGCIITDHGLVVLPLPHQPNENNWVAEEEKLCLNLNSKKKLLAKCRNGNTYIEESNYISVKL